MLLFFQISRLLVQHWNFNYLHESNDIMYDDCNVLVFTEHSRMQLGVVMDPGTPRAHHKHVRFFFLELSMLPVCSRFQGTLKIPRCSKNESRALHYITPHCLCSVGASNLIIKISFLWPLNYYMTILGFELQKQLRIYFAAQTKIVWSTTDNEYVLSLYVPFESFNGNGNYRLVNSLF